MVPRIGPLNVAVHALERVVGKEHLPAVAGLDPTVRALEPHGAGPQAQPAVGAHDQLDAVFVGREHSVPFGPVLYRLRAVHPERPLAEVHGMRAPVQMLAARVEIVMAAPCGPAAFSDPGIRFVERPPRGRAEPEIPVEFLRVRKRLLGEPVGQVLQVINRGVHRVDLAEFSSSGQLAGVTEIPDVPALRPALKNRPVEFHRFGQFFAQVDRNGARLFAVNVLSGPGRPDRGVGVPAVAGRDQHGIHVLAVEQVAEIPVHRDVVRPLGFLGLGLDLEPADFRHVGDGREPDVGLIEKETEVVAAAVVDPDAAEDDFFRGRGRPVEAQYGAGNEGRDARGGGGADRLTQKMTAGKSRLRHKRDSAKGRGSGVKNRFIHYSLFKCKRKGGPGS